MEMLKKKMMELWKDEEGATMVEYGLMVALIAVALITIVITMQGSLEGVFQEVSTQLDAAGGGAGG